MGLNKKMNWFNKPAACLLFAVSNAVVLPDPLNLMNQVTPWTVPDPPSNRTSFFWFAVGMNPFVDLILEPKVGSETDPYWEPDWDLPVPKPSENDFVPLEELHYVDGRLSLCLMTRLPEKGQKGPEARRIHCDSDELNAFKIGNGWKNFTGFFADHSGVRSHDGWTATQNCYRTQKNSVRIIRTTVPIRTRPDFRSGPSHHAY